MGSLNGELVPEGGGDNIPLIRDVLTIGRRESCDICFRFPNVSSLHCELFYQHGLWWLKDLGSTNGVKVNGVRIQTKKRLMPGDKITIAKKTFAIDYSLPAGQRTRDEILEDMEEEDIMSQPLLERAGLVKPQNRPPGQAPGKSANRNAPYLENDDTDDVRQG
jgi:pSer/pThr/pTyr-binding forkhead associated (FHA) protein